MPERRDIKSEDLLAYELGYRYEPTVNLSLDVTAYYNSYKNLLIWGGITAGAENYGLEIAADWDLSKWWSLRASYTYLHMHVRIDESDMISFSHFKDSNDIPPLDVFFESSSPNHQFGLRSSFDLSRDLELDLDLRYVDNLDIFVGSYTEMDARLAWSPRDDLEVSLVGRNLLHSHHLEFMSRGYAPFSQGEDIDVERSIYGKVTCRF